MNNWYLCVISILLFCACSNQVEVEDSSNNANTQLLKELKNFLLENQYSVINYDRVDLLDSLENPIVEILGKKSYGDRFRRGIIDSLTVKIDPMHDFSAQFDKGDELEKFRLVKWSFAGSLRNFHVIYIVNKKNRLNKLDSVYMKEYDVSFSKGCLMPMDVAGNGKEKFTSNCYEIQGQNEKLLTQENFDSLRKIFGQSELYNTAYFQHSRRRCSGWTYDLYHSYKINAEKEEEMQYVMPCPGELSAIFIVSEEILKNSELELKLFE